MAFLTRPIPAKKLRKFRHVQGTHFTHLTYLRISEHVNDGVRSQQLGQRAGVSVFYGLFEGGGPGGGRRVLRVDDAAAGACVRPDYL